MKDDALQVRRVERIHGRGVARRHRNADLHPCGGGEITRVLAERLGRGEAARECRDLESFARVGQYYVGQIRGRYWLRRIDPEVEVPAGELRRAVAEIYEVDLGVPAAAGRGVPVQSQRVRRREERVRVDRQPPV